MLLNPALTGLYNGDLRIIANARTQWNAITNGYKTVIGSVDAKIIGIGRNDMVGGGIQVLSDHAGDLDFTTMSTSIYGSYLKSIGSHGRNFLSLGLQQSLISNNYDLSKAKINEPDPLVLGGADQSKTFYDITIGLAWFFHPRRDVSFYLGAAGAHLTQPNVGFFKNIETTDVELYQKLTLHGGAEFRLNRKIFLKPSFILADQGPHREILLGSFFKYKSFKRYSNTPGAAVHLGAWLRFHSEREFTSTDAAVCAIRMDIDDMYMTFSFDLNISTLSRVSDGRGGT